MFVLFLYAAIGFFGAGSLGLFATGLAIYFTRMGLDNRKLGIVFMEWAVAMLFAVFLLGLLLRVLE